MKKLFTLALLILAFSSQAQVPDYFADNPQWRQDWWFGGALPCLEIYNYVYYLNGDSIVGDKTYKKVFKRGSHEQNWMAPPPMGNCTGTTWFDYLEALVRQDGRKMYIHEGGQNEALLYDFDLEVGDTLPQTYNVMDDDMVVESIDSLLIGESYRKVFNLQDAYPDLISLIEGIGFNQGFLEYVPDWEFPAQLMCFALDGVTYYPTYGAPCDMVTGIEDPEIPGTGIEIFPNPSSGHISIKFNSDSKALVKIYVSDIVGRKLMDEKWSINQGVNLKSLDLSSFGKGVYFISKIGEQGERFGQQKLVVK